MKVYGFAIFTDNSFTTNVTESIFSPFAADIMVRHANQEIYRYHRSNILGNFSDAIFGEPFKRTLALEDIRRNMEASDLVVIQTYCKDFVKQSCDKLGEPVPVIRNHDDLISTIDHDYGNIWNDDFQNRKANEHFFLHWLIDAHIIVARELDKPLIMYSFDPELEDFHGIRRPHGFMESDKMRYLPVLEVAAIKRRRRIQRACQKTIDFAYSGRLNTFGTSFDARKYWHRSILDCIKKHDSVYKIQTDTGWHQSEYFPEISTEDEYFKLIANAKYVPVTVNYSGITISVKRAADAVAMTSCPIFFGPKELLKQLPEVYNAAPKISSPEDFEEFMNDKTLWIDRLAEIIHGICAIDFESIKETYVKQWPTFKNQYLPKI